MSFQTPIPPVARGMMLFWRVAVVVGVLVMIGVFAARPGYRWIKAKRAQRLVQEAVPLVAAGKWDEVRPRLEVAAQLAPFEPRVRWLLARFYSAGGMAQGLDFWNTVPAGTLTREDRLVWAGLALRHSRLDVAARLSTALLAEFPDEPEVVQLAMLTAERHGDSAQSLGYAERWLARAPESPAARWHVGQRLLRVREPGRQAEGRRLLFGLVKQPGAFQLLAAGLLADDPGLPPSERKELVALLGERQAPLLILAAAEFRLGPDHESGVIARVVAAAQGETNAPALTAQIDWLVQHGASSRVTEILTPEKVAARPRLRSARIQALLEAGRAAEAREEIVLLDPTADALQTSCFQAWLARAAQQETQVESHLASALTRAGNSVGGLRFVAEYAVRLGRPALAVKAYGKMLGEPAGAIEAGRSLATLAAAADDVDVLLQAVEGLGDHLPGDLGLQTLRVYLRFLRDRGSRQDLDWVAGQAAAPGANGLILASRALGRWRLGEAAQGLEEVEMLSPDLRQGEARLQMGYAILLAANQQREAARLMARRIPEGRLQREERRVLEETLR